MPENNQIRLTAQSPNMWLRGVAKSLYLANQIDDLSGWGEEGQIQFSSNPDGPYTGIEAGPWFEGASPFPFDPRDRNISLAVTPGDGCPVGAYHFRLLFTKDGIDQWTNHVKVSVKSVSNGSS